MNRLVGLGLARGSPVNASTIAASPIRSGWIVERRGRRVAPDRAGNSCSSSSTISLDRSVGSVRNGKFVGDSFAQIGDWKAAGEAVEGDKVAHLVFADLMAAGQIGQPAQFSTGDLPGGVEAAQGQCSLRAAV